jgi:hypothetical protein
MPKAPHLFVNLWDSSSRKFGILEQGIAHYAWLSFGVQVISIRVEASEYCMSQKLVITGWRTGTVHSGEVKISVNVTQIETTDTGIHIFAKMHDAINMLKARYLTNQVRGIRC